MGGGTIIQPAKQDRVGPLTFSPTPSLDQSEFLEATTQADDDQAELMTDWATYHLFN